MSGTPRSVAIRGTGSIASQFREAIESGQYPPGARLPGENDVMRGTGRGTRDRAARRWPSLLTGAIAEARKGSGIYVRDFRPILREGISRLGASTWPSGKSVWATEAEGRDLTVDQIEVSEVDAPDHIRPAARELPEDAKTVLRSRRFILDWKAGADFPLMAASRDRHRYWPSPSPTPAPAASMLAWRTWPRPRQCSARTCAPG